MINGSWIAQACFVMARLGAPDLLASGARTAEELATATGTHVPSLRRLLSALGSVDLCKQRDDGSCELTRLGSLLRTDVPNSLRAWALRTPGELETLLRAAGLEPLRRTETGSEYQLMEAGASDASGA